LLGFVTEEAFFPTLPSMSYQNVLLPDSSAMTLNEPALLLEFADNSNRMSSSAAKVVLIQNPMAMRDLPDNADSADADWRA